MPAKKPAPKKRAPAKKQVPKAPSKPRAGTTRSKPGPKESPAQDRLNATGTEGICELIRSGHSYREIAATHQVGLGRLAEWIESDPERSSACARAREMAAQSFDEQALDAINGAKNAFELAKAREAAIHLRWRAKAANPRRYGEKVAVGGAEDLPPVKSVHELSTEALMAIAAQGAGA